MKRSPIKRGTKGLERRTRLRPVSRKRRAEERAWRDVKAVVLERDGGICAAAGKISLPCAGPLEAHHLANRSTTPQARLDPENIRLLCHLHHAYVTTHPREAHRLGLHRPSWEYKATG